MGHFVIGGWRCGIQYSLLGPGQTDEAIHMTTGSPSKNKRLSMKPSEKRSQTATGGGTGGASHVLRSTSSGSAAAGARSATAAAAASSSNSTSGGPSTSGAAIIAPPPRVAVPSSASTAAGPEDTGAGHDGPGNGGVPTPGGGPGSGAGGGGQLPGSSGRGGAKDSSSSSSRSASAAAAAASLALKERDARIADLEREMATMEAEFQRELDKLSANESETAVFWQAKHSALNQQFLRADTELRLLRAEVELREAERDELRAGWEGLRRDAAAREDEARRLRQQVRGLKDFVSTSTRTGGQTSDEVFGEGMARLGNGLQNWIIVNFRRAKLGVYPYSFRGLTPLGGSAMCVAPVPG